MQKIPSEVHGVLDYLTGSALLALPRVLGWRGSAARLLTMAALLHLAYSLFTNYELGLVKALPFKAHLALDGLAGATLAAAPLILQDQEASVTAVITALGVYELTVTALTNPEPFQNDWANDLVNQVRDEIGGRFETAQEKVQSR